MCENALSVSVDTEIKIDLLTLVCRLMLCDPEARGDEPLQTQTLQASISAH